MESGSLKTTLQATAADARPSTATAFSTVGRTTLLPHKLLHLRRLLSERRNAELQSQRVGHQRVVERLAIGSAGLELQADDLLAIEGAELAIEACRRYPRRA